jgi:probable HAF family extracellular repeat protein
VFGSAPALAYDPTTDTWAHIPDLPIPRKDLAAVAAPDGRIYTVGGFNGSAAAGVAFEAYTPGLVEPVALAPTPTPVGPTPLPRRTPTYQLTDLGALPDSRGMNGVAYGINTAAHVVGQTDSPAGLVAFIWRDGAMQSLGMLPGDTQSIAYAINDKDQVVGESFGPEPREISSHAFVWEDGVMLNVGTLTGQEKITRAFEIDNDGRVRGLSDGHSFNWQSGRMNSEPGAWSSRAINASGNAIGWDLGPGVLRPSDGVDPPGGDWEARRVFAANAAGQSVTAPPRAGRCRLGWAPGSAFCAHSASSTSYSLIEQARCPPKPRSLQYSGFRSAFCNRLVRGRDRAMI